MLFESKKLKKKKVLKSCKKVYKKIFSAIDQLDIVKDSGIYTFQTSLSVEVDKYFKAKKNNPKEQKRFDKQTKKKNKLLKKGKKVDWKVLPLSLVDLDEQIETIVSVVASVREKFEKDILKEVDYKEKAVNLIDYFKEKASGVVNIITKGIARERAIKLMEEVGIPQPRIRYKQYPFEFSGGMRQRIVIAIALAADPDILICDEPTTALDVTIQAQILELINKLKRERNLSIIFITHDLGVVANMADRIAVMYAGKIVEYGTSEDIFYDPRHPYTWALLSSMPDLNTNEKLESIPGTPPNMIYPPVGDAFASRNKYALEIDFEEQPPFFDVSETHKAATWLLHPDAPKVEIPRIITERIKAMRKQGGADNGKQ
ncbi:MAG: ABC transporter ATP-binding protein [Clostridia bacterium]|nr:ABC transporter ATP-binding protein [Clostridia bacterium]